MRVSEDLPQTVEQRDAQVKARVVPLPRTTPTDPQKWAPEIFDWEELQRQGPPPPRTWIVNEWIGFYNTLLAGIGGAGKSYFVQQLCTAVALGQNFVGQINEPLTTLAWLTEDDSIEVITRQFRICERLGVSLDALAGRLIMPIMEGEDCCLMEMFEGQLLRTSMANALREQIGDYKVKLVALDNISVLFGGKDIERNHVARFYQMLRWCAKPTGAGIILVGHTAKDKESQYAGSAAWEQLARARLWFTEAPPDAPPERQDEDDAANDKRYLSKRKVNYTSRDICIFRFDFKTGFEMLTAPQAGGIVASISRERARSVVLTAYGKLKSMNYQPSEGHTSSHYLPKLIIQHGFNEGFTKFELTQAMHALMTDNALQRSAIGEYPNRTIKYGLTLGTPADAEPAPEA